MNCGEFEQVLHQQADGDSADFDAPAMRSHSQECASCRELQDGVRLVGEAFLVSRLPEASTELTERVVAAAIRDRRSRQLIRSRNFWFAAAAVLLAATGWWMRHPGTRNGLSPTLAENSSFPTHHTPALDSPLFPELGSDGAGDSRDGVIFADAVEPVSEIFRAISRSLGSPVRPAAATATEALGNFFKDLPDPESPMMSVPGMQQFMPQPMKKKMGEMGPSS